MSRYDNTLSWTTWSRVIDTGCDPESPGASTLRWYSPRGSASKIRLVAVGESVVLHPAVRILEPDTRADAETENGVPSGDARRVKEQPHRHMRLL